MWTNRCPTRLLNHIAYARLPWISKSNPLVKVTTFADNSSLFHFLTFFYPPLLLVIYQNPGQLMSHCMLHPGDGSASIWNRRCPSFLGFARQGVLLGVWCWAQRFFSLVWFSAYSQCSFGSGEIRYDDSRFESSDWNCSPRLSSKVSCAGRVFRACVTTE